MSKRHFYLADGTLRSMSAGRFRGDDEIAETTITERIVVRDDGGTQSHQAPVHMDPNNPDGPVVITFDSDDGQKGLTVIDEANNQDIFEVSNLGVMTTAVEAALYMQTDDLEVDGEVSGSAFDTGAWVHSSSAVPTKDTVVTRNATTESVNVSNLRVGTKTAFPKS